jgi:UDP-N-acetylmuramoyl-L-alanyl-D-glutamate--2,6-diaminopimelate ligase
MDVASLIGDEFGAGPGAGGISVIGGPVRGRIVDLTEDSRTVLPGSLFVARPGLAVDGRRFIAEAVRDGAVAVLTDAQGAAQVDTTQAVALVAEDLPRAVAAVAERFFGFPSRRLRLIGVTGTNGKTTVAHLTHGLLNACGRRCGLIGTVSIDDGREVAASDMTTLPAIELSRTLATMVEHGCEAAVMEVSSHALDQGRVAGLAFDVGVFTSLGRDHLDYHGTPERYAASKARLFSMLPAEGLAVVNVDDPGHGAMLAGCPSGVLRCSLGGGAVSAEIMDSSLSGMRARLRGPFGALEARLPMVGEHNAMNMLQAICSAHAVGARPEELLGAVTRLTPPPGRLEAVHGPDDDLAVLVDYAHTPDAIERTLTAVRRVMAQGRLWIVFGCGGNRDRGKRPAMGAVAARLADRVVLTSDNPRLERPSEILGEILAGMDEPARERTLVHADRGKAIESAVLLAEPGDVVLIAGKGHETTQSLPDGAGGLIVRPFDDRTEARACLRARAMAVRA